MDGEVVVVAVDASKEITDYALEWTVHNLIKSRDFLFLLAIHPSGSLPPPSPCRTNPLRTSQFFSNLFKKCRGEKEKSFSGVTRPGNGAEPGQAGKIYSVCEIMMKQLLSACKLMQVKTELRVIMDSQLGSVAAAAEEIGATWVVLDRRLKKEGDSCVKHLACNVVLVDHAIPRILKAVSPQIKNKLCHRNEGGDPYSAAQCSFEFGSSNARIEIPSSVSTYTKDQVPGYGASINDANNRKPYIYLNSQYFQKDVEKTPTSADVQTTRRASTIPPEAKRKSFSGPVKVKKETVRSPDLKTLKPPLFPARRSVDSMESVPRQSSPNKLKELINRKGPLVFYGNKSAALPGPSLERTSSIRRTVSLSMKKPPVPPPLCSVCKHNMTRLSNAPRKFIYGEIDRATNGFAKANFLAEGGFGPVYKGVLPDGQVIAVKQHKHLSAQGASEFCTEVEVLSCAQHKNLVRLVGYCIETEWLLVYEFACNGSLNKHLFENEGDEAMTWHSRMKVAKGAARGLRYLHEDCRVGCIIHRDFRPNNILLTHDYEPMVGDFGLARWQADGESAEETELSEHSGKPIDFWNPNLHFVCCISEPHSLYSLYRYLAPEYTQTGLVTQKTDVYAYGIVLLELISGFKGTEFSKIAGKQFVSDWGLPLLKGGFMDELIDPRLSTDYDKREVELMMLTAELCLSSLPKERPSMSQALKILDGDVPNTANSRSVQHAYSYASDETRILATPPSVHGRRHSSAVTSQPLRNGEAEGNCDAYNSEMLVREDFQAYLRGSLAKFIENMNSQGSLQSTPK